MSYYASSQPEVRVVQGTVVGASAVLDNNPKYDETTMNYTQMDSGGYNSNNNSNAVVRGQSQPKRCNDLFWALLFIGHLIGLACATSVYMPAMYSSAANSFQNKRGGERNLLLHDNDSMMGVLDLREIDMEAREAGTATSLLEERSGLFVHAFSTVMNNIVYGSNGQDITLGYRNLEDVEENDKYTADETEVIFLLIVTFIIGFVMSSLTLGFMMIFAESLIKCALWFNIITAGCLAMVGFVSGIPQMALMGLIAFAISAYYAYCVWSRVPFAATNLISAATAVRSNFGVTFFAYAALFVAFLWSVWWALTMGSTFYVVDGCEMNGQCESDPAWYLVFLFFLSYYWTAQVIQNTVHVTVAGTVGTWWFTPLEASSCCSSAVRSSWIRSVTSAFGSICLGSLIVAIIQATKEIMHSIRENSDSCLACLLECILGWIEWIFEYFNRWAFVYVGLYGYSFMEAGTNVINLFKARGWTTIITDNLVDNVLTMVSGGVGVLTGLAGVLLCSVFKIDVGGEGYQGAVVPFGIGFIAGFVICSVLMSVVSSAVNTVIVCYAEAPNEFQQSHPQLSNNMRAAWKQAWPAQFNYA